MKVKVLKEMPFATVGKIYESYTDLEQYEPWQKIMKFDGLIIKEDLVKNWINSGWVEEVKEESLFDKFCEYGSNYNHYDGNFEEMVKIAKEHYLEVFDKATEKTYKRLNYSQALENVISDIRHEIEQT